MPAMPILEYPAELAKSHWDRKKGALAAGGTLENRLKALQKKHEAVDWRAFDPGWEAKAANTAALDEALEQLEKLYRGKVFPLKLEAGGVEDEANKLARDKAAGKPSQDAGKSIADAAKVYARAVDSVPRLLADAHAKAAAALKKAGADDEEEEDRSALLDPKRLFAQLQHCRRDPERRVHFAFLGDGKTEPMLTVSPRTAGKRLFAKLQAETGVKTGAYGMAWVDANVLYLRMDKPLSGLVKRVRAPLKAIGFKVGKVVLAGEDGAVVEEDVEDDQPQGQPTAPAERETPPPDRQAALDRLRALQPLIAAALRNPKTDASRLRAVLAFVTEKSQAGDFAAALKGMDQIDKLLAAAPAGGPPPGDAPAPAPGPAKAPRVVFTQARLVWDQTRKNIQSKLQTLEQALLAACANEADIGEIARNTRLLYTVLDYLDERLIDKLDEALNATTEAERKAFHDEAREIVNEYLDYVAGDEFVRDLDDNGFVDIALIDTVTKRLQTLDKALKAA